MEKVIILLIGFGLMMYAMTVNPQVMPALALLTAGYIGIILFRDRAQKARTEADHALDPHAVVLNADKDSAADRIFGSSLYKTPAPQQAPASAEAGETKQPEKTA